LLQASISAAACIVAAAVSPLREDIAKFLATPGAFKSLCILMMAVLTIIAMILCSVLVLIAGRADARTPLPRVSGGFNAAYRRCARLLQQRRYGRFLLDLVFEAIGAWLRRRFMVTALVGRLGIVTVASLGGATVALAAWTPLEVLLDLAGRWLAQRIWPG
jgi:hypothetical protein